MDIGALWVVIRSDRDQGFQPILVIGMAGSVDTGANRRLAALTNVCAEQGVWFHVDAAYGAIAMLSPALGPLFADMEHADAVAFDFPKWAQV